MKCNHKPQLIEFYIKGVANKKNYFVKCEKCKQRTRSRNSKQKAVDEWNEHEGKLYEFYRKV